jgi:7-cyano-7-deazaguanine synthase
MRNGKALVLLSGGQDSTTCCAWARERYGTLHTISFYYGQRHRVELEWAARISELAGAASHHVVDYAQLFAQVTRSPLMEADAELAAPSALDPSLPASFVPYRNVFFLTAAAAHAYFLEVRDLVIGICQTDYSGYPDCRNEFAKAINTALTLASGRPLEIHTPLMWLTKAESVHLMGELGRLDWLRWSHTCYEGRFPPCGACPACKLRAKGFAEAGVPDPLVERAIAEGLLPPDADPYGLR